MKNLNRAGLFLCVFAMTALAGASGAFAQIDPTVADNLGDAIDTGFADTSDFILTRGVPVVVGGIVLGLIIRTAFRWMRKAGRAVG